MILQNSQSSGMHPMDGESNPQSFYWERKHISNIKDLQHRFKNKDTENDIYQNLKAVFIYAIQEMSY